VVEAPWLIHRRRMQTTSETAWQALPQPFLAREAHAAGLSSTSIAGAVRRKQIIPVAPSVYAVREGWVELTPSQLHGRMSRAAAASVEVAVVSHQSAALIHGLPHPLGPLGSVSLTLRDSSKTAARDDWRRLLDGELPDVHVTQVDGVPVTTVDRTVIDSFRQLRPRDALAIADGALHAGLTCPEELQAMRAFQTRWPGVRKADVGLAMVDFRRESWLESASVATAHQQGFSVPMSQMWIHDLDGRPIGRVDFLWSVAGVIGEADGRGKYLGSYSKKDWDPEEAAVHMVAERDRERELEAVGFAVARWGTSDLLDRGAGLARALKEARRRADPRRIRCLWRQDPRDDLRPWRLAVTPMDGGDGPWAA
jgi:hypothetical protein